MTTSPRLAPNAIETSTIRKVRSRIIPFIMVLMVIASLDRMNIGFAALTMNKELAITSQQYGFLARVFFLGYFVFEIPSNLLLHKIGASVWLARILISWGIVARLDPCRRDRYRFSRSRSAFHPSPEPCAPTKAVYICTDQPVILTLRLGSIISQIDLGAGSHDDPAIAFWDWTRCSSR